METARLNRLMYKPLQDENFALSVGVRASFADEDDNTKSQDSDNDSSTSTSDLDISDLKKRILGSGSLTSEIGSMPLSISGSNSAPSGSAPEACESESQYGETLKKMLKLKSGNASIQQSATQTLQSTNFTASKQETHQRKSHGAENHETYPFKHEQHPHMHHQQQNDNCASAQQHLNYLYTPWNQQPGVEQTLQFPMQLDMRYAQVYQQQVQTSPSPQPSVYQVTSQPLQYGPSVLIPPSPLIAPQTQIIDQHQWPNGEQSCSDTLSVSSVGSSFPSVVSTPAYHGSYWDPNLGSQPIINPLSARCYPVSQVIQQNVVPCHNLPSFDLNNAQGHSVRSDMKCSSNRVTEMTMSSTPGQPQLELDTANVNMHINIAPLPTSSKNQQRVKTKWSQSYIHTEKFSYANEDHERHSNLYVNWIGTAVQLRHVLELKSLEVHRIESTTIKDLWNVVFDSHSSARKAFTTQREIKIRMVPPRKSKKNWLRNPSPKFLVQYEIKCRLDVRQGKALGKDIVGVLLMSRSSCEEREGCHIWADQLKGHRIRIVGCVGKFMFPSERIIDMKEIPKKSVGNNPIGWVSYRNRHTREDYVTRISGNLLQDYIYNG